jgi:NADH-quinone oxidoreductase subunit C
MDNRFIKMVQVLKEQTGAVLEEAQGEVHLIVQSQHIADVLTYLLDQHEFSLLSALTATDYWPEEKPRFHVIYQLTSLTQNLSLQVRVPVDGDKPSVPSVAAIYANANWREREVMDMFGIQFVGHPDPRRILMPSGWNGHPLRKDFPLGYEEPQFTFNLEEIDKRKPYARE